MPTGCAPYRLAIVATCLLAFSAQAVAAPRNGLLPSAAIRMEWGGPAQSRQFSASLSLRQFESGVFGTDHAQGAKPLSIHTLRFETSGAEGNALYLLGSPMVKWGLPVQSEFALQQNGQSEGSWFSRNWWLLGLGAVAVGVVAAAAGGGSSSETNRNTNTGNQTNCGVAGTVVGAPGSPTTVANPNCLP